MMYLILSILCSTIIGIVFKQFPRFKIDNFQAIIYNYIVCTIIGTLVLGELPVKAGFWEYEWFPYAFFMGCIFIGTFVLIARTVQTFGMSVTSVVQRMSLLISVTFAIVYFNESTTWTKMLGIILALVAVFFASIKKEDKQAEHTFSNRWLYFLPFLVFALSGLIEIILQYVQTVHLSNNAGQLQFTTFLFGTAAAIGFILLIFNLAIGKMQFHTRHVIAGIVLGIPNFGSIYFILKMLEQGWEGSVFFPINNVGVILLSTAVALIIFKEQLSKLNIIGIVLAILGIVLISL